MKVRLDHINMRVQNLKTSIDWYKKVFSFKVVETGTSSSGLPWAILQSGDALLCLYENAELTPNTGRINHIAIAIPEKLDILEILNSYNTKALYGGAVHYPFSTSYYVLDPDGLEIEIVQWQHDAIYFDHMEANYERHL